MCITLSMSKPCPPASTSLRKSHRPKERGEMDKKTKILRPNGWQNHRASGGFQIRNRESGMCGTWCPSILTKTSKQPLWPFTMWLSSVCLKPQSNLVDSTRTSQQLPFIFRVTQEDFSTNPKSLKTQDPPLLHHTLYTGHPGLHSPVTTRDFQVLVLLATLFLMCLKGSHSAVNLLLASSSWALLVLSPPQPHLLVLHFYFPPFPVLAFLTLYWHLLLPAISLSLHSPITNDPHSYCPLCPYT